MFREKLHKDPNQRGYLYIRESYYERDKRTHKRKPSKLCDGTATKERGKYSKKKDIYCGKIHEIEIKIIENFEGYLKKQNKEYLEFKINSKFDDLIDEFVKYLLYIYELDEDEFYNGKKRVYALGDGYLSKETIIWLKNFEINGNYDNFNEIKRFSFRCQDCGIYDEDIINTLYLKLVPKIDERDIKEEIEELENQDEKREGFTNLRNFLKRNLK